MGDRIWALEEALTSIELGALLIYYDVDVTIRPTDWHRNLARLILDQDTRTQSTTPAQIFLVDTWTGTECVNSGFVAFQNTHITHLFLKLWKEKMYWAAGWDQAALAETVLEILGAEAWKISGGKLAYDYRCLG